MNYKPIIARVVKQLENFNNCGEVADYISELRLVDPHKFGIHLTTIKNKQYSFGDAHEKFSIQSIAKVLSLVLAFKLENNHLWKRVGVEPSGTSFNSLAQLELDGGIPRNPLINSGAIVICDVLISHLKNPKKDFIEFVRKVSGIETIDYCPRIAESEKLTGYRNTALVNLMKAYNNIHNDIDEIMDFYFNLCSIEMTCQELSQTFLFLANHGICPATQEKIISKSKSKRINAIMQSCGFYDEAGEFAFKVGLPGKSGVGGGIIAIYPHKYSIAVWSPKLNKKGNSTKGVQFLELFTTETQTSIF
ncbi:glutaminase [uncultured Lutibacter sp.]|uniref:glutaminase n=1 Tax=uncultured Lutibacter sp. TaxID=437739 RepID=UPI002610BF16|nr:glutaminase [uncultured Lutibacter sp.]